ncbi:MAG: hypothetical protein HXY41_05570 [Chloroflexi bacterium]|nr:hypothetical protein [Chloroflexota bacterium]
MRLRYLNIHGLQARLILVFMALILLPLAGVGLYDYFFTNNALVPQVLQRLANDVHLRGIQIVAAVESAQADVYAMGGFQSLRRLRLVYRQDKNSDQAALWRDEVAQDFMALAASHPAYYQLQYLDADGSEVVRVDFAEDGPRIVPDAELRSRADAPFFRETMALACCEVYVSSVDAEPRHRDGQTQIVPVIRYALRLEDGGGLVAISLHAASVLGDLTANASRAGRWAVFDQDGALMLLDGRYHTPATPGPHLLSLYPQAAKLLEGGAGVYETDTDLLVYDTVYPAPNQPERFWVLYYDTPKHILFADITNFHYTVSIFLLGTFLTAIALVMLASERIVTPILGLKRRVEQFGRDGIVPGPPDHIRRDEIGALDAAFCDMALELERKRENQRRLIERLITAQEEERKLVAYDLHDGLIQQMVGARFHLINFLQQCDPELISRSSSLQRGCDALSEAIAEGRRIIEGLHPAVLDDLGLSAALEEVARTISDAAGWELRADIEQLSGEPDRMVSVTLYRIAQEALNNARKHAQATVVSLRLSNSNGLLLTIRDNGRGFNPDVSPERSRGLGITTMRERASLVDGRCTIHSAPGSGTTVEAWVPCTVERGRL